MGFITFAEKSSKNKKKKKTGKPVEAKQPLPGIFGEEARKKNTDVRFEYTAKPGSRRLAKERKSAGDSSDDDAEHGEEDDVASDVDDSDEEEDESADASTDDSDDDESRSGDRALAALEGVRPEDFHQPRTLRNLKKKRSNKSKDFFGASFAIAVANVLAKEPHSGRGLVLGLAPQYEARVAVHKREEKQQLRKQREKKQKKKQSHVVLRENKQLVWNEREKALRSTASTAVMQLFNAVRAAQLEKNKILAHSAGKIKEADPEEIAQQTFYTLLKQTTGGGDRPAKPKQRDAAEEVKTDDASMTTWSALDEDFGMRATLKSWDEEDDDQQQEVEFADSEEEEDD